jgi:hypothetical protein
MIGHKIIFLYFCLKNNESYQIYREGTIRSAKKNSNSKNGDKIYLYCILFIQIPTQRCIYPPYSSYIANWTMEYTKKP